MNGDVPVLVDIKHISYFLGRLAVFHSEVVTWLSPALWRWSWGELSRPSPCWDPWSMTRRFSLWGMSSTVTGSLPAGQGCPGWAAPFLDLPLLRGGTELGGDTWTMQDQKTNAGSNARWLQTSFKCTCYDGSYLPQCMFARPRPSLLGHRHHGNPVREVLLWALVLHVAAWVSNQKR